MATNQFYIYRWIRLDTNTPFYVGKGKDLRFKEKSSGRNKYFKNIIKAVPCEVKVIISNLDEDQAFNKEAEFIKLYKSFGYCEANIAEGGNSSSSSFWTQERRNTMSLKKLGCKGPNKGRKFSKEYCEKLSKSKKGINCGSKNHKAKPIKDSLGNVFVTTNAAAKFHKKTPTTISNILNGWSKQTKQGVTFAYINKVGG
jgi:hypothetical protein